MTESLKQPTVSVHSIPQSQYNANLGATSAGATSAGTTGGVAPVQGGIIGNIKQHWVLWSVGGAIAIAVVILYLRGTSGSSTSSTGTSSATGNDPSTGLWGSQLDADYQQMISQNNQIIGLLNQQNPTTSGSTGGTVNPPSNKPPTSNPPTSGPILPGRTPPTYTVKGGDTLFGIAQKEGFSSWQDLYNHAGNASIIQSTAQSHGQWNPSKPGQWIYPGEKLNI